MPTLLRIFARTWRYPWRAVGTLLLAVACTLLVVVLPALTKEFTDEVIPKGQTERIVPLALLGVGAIALRQFLFTLRTVSNNHFEQAIVHDLRRELYGKIQRLPMRWFDNQPTGDIMTRVASDVPAMERVIIEGLDQGVSGFLQFAVVFGYLLTQHVGLTLLTVAPLPLVALAVRWYQRKAEPRFKAASEAGSALNSLLHDNIAGIRQIKAYTVEPEELNRFDAHSRSVQQAQLSVVKANAVIWPFVSLVAESGIVLTIAFAAWWICRGTTTLGTLSAVLMSWGLLYDPVSRVNPLTQMFTAGIVAGKRVFAILDLTDEPNLDDGRRPDSLRGDVVFDDVTFSYADKAPTISGIRIRAGAGQTIALVGPTGAGKSTVLNLLTRFYEPDTGRILLDGEDISGLSKEWLRDHIGYVTQDSFLFNASIRGNLLVAKPDATEAELWAALSAANAADFVRRLPEGLDTATGERGTRLSGGERQRLSIARALLKNPPILLLDEATSAVDNETEKLIQQALERLRSDRTCFVIAHRLSTVENADRIYVLERGHIREEGTHQELLAHGGLYARLCASGLREDTQPIP
jgi:ATP-binding cassette subfamily B protein/subfamily B ATP-binding cassette protein MsbA